MPDQNQHDTQEHTNTNAIYPSIPEDDFLANSEPVKVCELGGECESCQ